MFFSFFNEKKQQNQIGLSVCWQWYIKFQNQWHVELNCFQINWRKQTKFTGFCLHIETVVGVQSPCGWFPPFLVWTGLGLSWLKFVPKASTWRICPSALSGGQNCESHCTLTAHCAVCKHRTQAYENNSKFSLGWLIPLTFEYNLLDAYLVFSKSIPEGQNWKQQQHTQWFLQNAHGINQSCSVQIDEVPEWKKR